MKRLLIPAIILAASACNPNQPIEERRCCPGDTQQGFFIYPCAICCDDGRKVATPPECDPPDEVDGLLGACENIGVILQAAGIFDSRFDLPEMEIPPQCQWVHQYGSTPVSAEHWDLGELPYWSAERLSLSMTPHIRMEILDGRTGPFDASMGYVANSYVGPDDPVCPTGEGPWLWPIKDHRLVVPDVASNASVWQDVSTALAHEDDHQFLIVFWLSTMTDSIINDRYGGQYYEAPYLGEEGIPIIESVVPTASGTEKIGFSPIATGKARLKHDSDDVVFNFGIFNPIPRIRGEDTLDTLHVWWIFLPEAVRYGNAFLEFWPHSETEYRHPQPVGAICSHFYDTFSTSTPPAECQHMSFNAGHGLDLSCTGQGGEAWLMGGVMGVNWQRTDDSGGSGG